MRFLIRSPAYTRQTITETSVRDVTIIGMTTKLVNACLVYPELLCMCILNKLCGKAEWWRSGLTVFQCSLMFTKEASNVRWRQKGSC